MTGDIYIYIYTCVSVIFLRIILYSTISQKSQTEKRLSALLDDLCLLFILYDRYPLSTDMDSSDGQNPVLDNGGYQQKGAGSVFQGGGSRITSGGSES